MSSQRPRSRRRRGPGPVLVLAAIALVPAVVLYAVYRWSSAQVDDREAAPLPDPTVFAAPPTDALTTAVLSMRRMPTIISRDVSIDAFSGALVPLAGSLNDRSCLAVSVDGVEVGSRNADLAVIPASNEKLVVAATALEQLGGDDRYTTTVAADAAPAGGAVSGNLYLVGGGDPVLSSDWYPDSNLERYPVTSPTSLDTLADQVVAAGVTSVSGAVVGDGSRYDDEFFAPGWSPGVAGLEAGPYDALLVNDARVLGDDQRAADPDEGAAREFARLLRDRGVVVAGAAASGTAPADAATITSIDSAPMSDVVAEMLGNSDNNTAELIVKELGFAVRGAGTREAGLQVMHDQLAAWGLDTDAVVLADGSGLSPANRLTCSVLIGILQRFDVDSPIASALPVAGESGTLSDVFVDQAIAGHLLGKTGTLGNPPFNVDPPAVKALSGYVAIDGGSTIEFSLVLNGPTINDQSEYRPVWDRLAEVLVTYPTGPTPAEIGPR